MIEVVGIRFKKAGKMYYFDPAGIKLEKEDGAIVETARGIEYGTVIKGNSFVPEEADCSAAEAGDAQSNRGGYKIRRAEP